MYPSSLGKQKKQENLGMTIIWDGIELYRQENHIRREHAPAKPHRPVEPRRE
jgi:hypothetical protein